jgi:hypothetical protein
MRLEGNMELALLRRFVRAVRIGEGVGLPQIGLVG